MKVKLIIIIGIFISIAYSQNDISEMYVNRWEYMSLTTASKRWGEAPFLKDKFKIASLKERAEMAVSLIKTKYGLGLEPSKIRAELGEFSGFFWSDQIPTYLLERKSSIDGKTWQIVFLLGNNQKVNEVKIQNNAPPKPISDGL